MLDERQAFKFGFLYRCAEEGLTPVETQARMEKAAAFVKRSTWIADTANTLAGLGIGGMALGAGTAIGTGMLGGAALAKATEPDVTPDELKAQEEIAAYNLFDKQIQQRNALRQIRSQAMAGKKPSFQFQ